MKEIETRAEEIKRGLDSMMPDGQAAAIAAVSELISRLWEASGKGISKRELFWNCKERIHKLIIEGKIEEAKEAIDEAFAV